MATILLHYIVLSNEMTPYRPIVSGASARPASGGLSKYWAKQLLSEYHRLPVFLPGPSLV